MLQKDGDDEFSRVDTQTYQTLNSIITACPHAIIAVDSERNVKIWNPAAEKMFGWSAAEVVGARVPFVSDDKREESNNFNMRALKGESFSNYGLQRTRRDGTVLDLLVSAAPTYDVHGKIDGFLTVATDVTEHKSLERQFLRTQRLESVGALASGIAHDLNNVLAPIRMSLQLLRERTTDAIARRTLDSLEVCVGRGADLIRQILTFARGVQGERIPVQMRHIIRDTKEVVLQTMPRSVEIEADIPNDLWTVTGDATQLQQVFMNLCLNARDAMPNGGTLSIRARNILLSEADASAHLALTPGPYLFVEVSDTGTGIAPDIQSKVFEPFFTTKELGKGTGLGLSTVAAIVRNHGGRIILSSEVGRGASFKVYFPALRDDADHAAAETPAAPYDGNGEWILVVDDEAAVRDIARLTLETHGYRVLEARDGAEGVAVYAQHRKQIRVVISDMDMPIMNGAAMMRSLETIDPDVKIICASGLVPSVRVPPSRVPNALRPILPKPYTAGELLQTVRDLMQVG
jgi:two-component system, cell cycle sensor histidine kinase and response regulator CckA